MLERLKSIAKYHFTNWERQKHADKKSRAARNHFFAPPTQQIEAAAGDVRGPKRASRARITQWPWIRDGPWKQNIGAPEEADGPPAGAQKESATGPFKRTRSPAGSRVPY